jgi:hypothetical protein
MPFEKMRHPAKNGKQDRRVSDEIRILDVDSAGKWLICHLNEQVLAWQRPKS